MKRIHSIALLISALTISSTCFAQTPMYWKCEAIRGNQTEHWTWTSPSRSKSWNKVSKMCQNSHAKDCNIQCTQVPKP